MSTQRPTHEQLSKNRWYQRMSLIFNEWAIRYAEDPDSFEQILDEQGIPVEDYGSRCAFYFTALADELDAAGKLPNKHNS